MPPASLEPALNQEPDWWNLKSPWEKLMLEIIFGIFVCLLMRKIADMDHQSGITWFGVTFGLCILSLALPIPYLRFCLAGIVSGIILMYIKFKNK